MIRTLVVCTGNICRSPLAALLIADRNPSVVVGSAGTHARPGMAVPREIIEISRSLGVDSAAVNAHRSRMVTAEDIQSADLILAMARDHRRQVVELVPSAVRRTFTFREFGRLASHVSDAALTAAVDPAGPRYSLTRGLSPILELVSAQRAMLKSPVEVNSDDVIDPFQRSWATYQTSADQVVSSLPPILRVLGHVAPPIPAGDGDGRNVARH